MQILSRDGQSGGAQKIGFSHLRLSKKGKLLKSNFTVNRAQTLFGPAWENLKSGRCVHCGNKLYLSKSNFYLCTSKKHQRPFVISEKRFKELVDKQTSGREIYINS